MDVDKIIRGFSFGPQCWSWPAVECGLTRRYGCSHGFSICKALHQYGPCVNILSYCHSQTFIIPFYTVQQWVYLTKSLAF
jgi:hypothetical protein